MHVYQSRRTPPAWRGYGRGMGGGEANAITLPRDFNFRFSIMENPSTKVVAMDGVRYLKGGVLSFNIDDGSVYGSNFTSRGPAIRQGTGNTNGCPYKLGEGGDATKTNDDGRKYAYRHPNDSINMVFFDGHVENREVADSRRLELYVPSETEIGHQVWNLSDPNTNWRPGDVVP